MSKKVNITTAAQALAGGPNPYDDVFAAPAFPTAAWERDVVRGATAAVAGDTLYEGVGGPVNFDELDGQTRLDIFNQILALPEVRQAVQRRNAALFEHMRRGGRNRNASARYENADLMLAQMIGFNVIGGAAHSRGNVKKYGTRRLFAGVDTTDPEKAALRQRCKDGMESALFLAAVMERHVADVNEALRQLFGNGNMTFDLFADVQLAMTRLRDVFGQSRSLKDPDVKPIFDAYVESIMAYLDKRMGAFLSKADAVERRKKQRKA